LLQAFYTIRSERQLLEQLDTHSAIDGRTTRHPGYAVSQRIRKQIEEFFGSWGRSVGGL